jgi:DNA-directed RNA polymerase subunit alpha
MLEADNTFGKFEFRPLEPGYAVTIGNALRRILLSGLEGYAICNIRIDGVQHEFATIPGVKEDVSNIILKLKQVRLKRIVDDTDTEKAVVKVSGQDVFKAGDIGKVLSGFEVLNPELVICHIDPSASFQIEITINKGRGYVPADENKRATDPIGVIAIDSIHTPIKKVMYAVDDYRVEQRTDYEKLTFDIETDGSIHPKEALKEAATILIQHFMLFSDERITLDVETKPVQEEFDESTAHTRQLLKTKLIDLDLSVRALNCLKAAEVETLGDLVSFNKADLLKFRNFGKKSLTELENLVASKNLEFGMNVSKYKLDKE